MKKLLGIIPAVAAALVAMPAAAANDISVVAVPNPVGIPEVLIVIALLTIAIWKKGWIRILLAGCIIVWGVFFMPYDIKMAVPLMAVGTVLFIQGILTQIQSAREATE